MWWGGHPIGYQLVTYLHSIWFLWAIFWCSMALLVVHRYFNDNIIVYVSLGLFALLLPEVLGISLYVYMYPYFVIGYLFNKYGLTNKIASFGNKIKIILSLLLLVAFVGLYMSYTNEDYIYISGTGIVKHLKQLEPEINLHQLSIDIFRYAIGLVGATCALIIIRVTYNHIGKNTSMLLGKIGQKSIGIYIISTMFFNNFILPHVPHREEFGYGMVILETVVILSITYLITYMLEKNKLTRSLMLGSR
ncbi:acyltransferase family protein [Prevotella corporis]|nr:acyltransferase family protein [Prevotella corporis]